MNIIIFAGGAGTRLWPLSRRNSPKQFEILKDDRSTLQMAVDRVRSFGMDRIFISTNKDYVDIVRRQISGIADDHIFSEPVKRDQAAAVALTLFRLKKRGVSGVMALLWSDHFMDYPDRFLGALAKADELVSAHPERIVFMGEKARFANQNLGWIKLGRPIDEFLHEFCEWRYRPSVDETRAMFENRAWVWNPGYFVFDMDTMLNWYREHMPEMYEALIVMSEDEEKIMAEYGSLEAVSFDKAIIEKLKPSQAVVLKVDLGWSDPGTIYALKEALTGSEDENFTKGNVVEHRCRDSFIYNEDKHKLVSAVGLDGIIVVNTGDSLLVCHKDYVPEITDLLDILKENGNEERL